jgi:hypothetical protein
MRYPQEQYLAPYLQLTGHANPFVNKQWWGVGWSTDRSFDDEVFVFFGRGKNKPHRTELHDAVCTHSTSRTLSCDGDVSAAHPGTNYTEPHRVYTIASRYRYGLSPPGRGWDCYRTYEYLLLGIIPIVDRTLWNESYDLLDGLPAIHVDGLRSDPHNVTQQRIVTAIHEYLASDDYQRNSFVGWDRLFLGYWRREVLKDAGRLQEMVWDEYGNGYYQGYRYTTTTGQQQQQQKQKQQQRRPNGIPQKQPQPQQQPKQPKQSQQVRAYS